VLYILGRDQSIVEAYESVSTVISTLNSVRTNINFYHARWYNTALKLAEEIDVSSEMPRTNKTQSHRDNAPADNASDYYRRTVTVPMVDHVLTDLVERFSKENRSRINAFYCIPSIMDRHHASWKVKLKDFMLEHLDDIPSIGTADAEIDRWEQLWLKEKYDELPSSVKGTLKKIMQGMYPNISQVLKVESSILSI